jgi:hypothetical protein
MWTIGRIVGVGLIAALLAVGTTSIGKAQQPASLSSPSASPSGWQFNIAPYLWLPSINTKLDYNLPPALGGRLPTEVTSGPGDYLPDLNFATMGTAEARYGRFSVLTDFMYTNGNGSVSDIKSLDFFGLPSHPISRSLALSVTTRMSSTIWTLAGGYTVLQGDWGDLVLLAGFRYAGVNTRSNYDLALMIAGPRGNGATFGGIGGISGSSAIWNGIAGFRGHIRLAHTALFIPYYFDIGAGGSDLTWQIASGLGYQFKSISVSALYRYLSFEQGDNTVIRHLSLGGPLIMVDLRF